jgi:adenylylsulfate kinase
VLVVLAGLPGVGKSTLACALAERLGALIIDKDAIRDAIFPPSEVDYSDPQNALSTDVAYMVIAYILERDPGKLIVLDGKPFSRQAQREEAREVAKGAGSGFRLIHCVAPDEVVRQRLEREAARDPRTLVADRTFAKYLRIKAVFEPIAMPHLVLDTTASLEEQVVACARFLTEEETP